MRFMVLVKGDARSEAGVLPSNEELLAMGKFNEEMIKAGIMLVPRPRHGEPCLAAVLRTSTASRVPALERRTGWTRAEMQGSTLHRFVARRSHVLDMLPPRASRCSRLPAFPWSPNQIGALALLDRGLPRV